MPQTDRCLVCPSFPLRSKAVELLSLSHMVTLLTDSIIMLAFLSIFVFDLKFMLSPRSFSVVLVLNQFSRSRFMCSPSCPSAAAVEN